MLKTKSCQKKVEVSEIVDQGKWHLIWTAVDIKDEIRIIIKL